MTQQEEVKAISSYNMQLFAWSQWGVYTGPTFLPPPRLVEFPPLRLSLHLMSCQPWIGVQPEAAATGEWSQSAIKSKQKYDWVHLSFKWVLCAAFEITALMFFVFSTTFTSHCWWLFSKKHQGFWGIFTSSSCWLLYIFIIICFW